MGGKECNKWNAFLMNLGLMDAWNLKESRKIGNKNFIGIRDLQLQYGLTWIDFMLMFIFSNMEVG
jgi:hypothetical protein